MKKFIVNIFILSSILTSIGFLSNELNLFLFKNEVYQTPDSCRILITGDSFVLNGIDPEKVHNSCNIAMLAEPTVLSYFKIRHIIANNNKIEKVVIPFSPTYFKPRYDRLFKDYWLAEEFFKRISGITMASDFKSFNMDRMKYIEWYSRYRFLPNKEYLSLYFGLKKDNKLPYIGQYFALDDFVKNYNYEDVVVNLYGNPVNLSGKENVSYLDSIAKLTSNKNIDLYIVGMPMHKELFDLLPIKVVGFCDQKISDISAKYPNMTFLNCYTLIEKSDFANLYHLGSSGADKLSEYINNAVSRQD